MFHNLRASCATDWIAEFPVPDVSNWLGHSATIGAAHYWQPRDANMDRAAGIVTGQAAAIPATNTRQSAPTRNQPEQTQNTPLGKIAKTPMT